MKINKVTITGADNDTDIKDLIKLSKKYPFVEWGILFSVTKEGTPRYPDSKWIKSLYDKDLLLSAHLCGWYSKQVIDEGDFNIIENLPNDIKRVQLNYNFLVSKEELTNKYYSLYKITKEYYNKNIILQYNEKNRATLDAFLLSKIPNYINFLYDTSGGQGKEIKEISDPIFNHYTGYAGGLNPDNIDDICQKIIDHQSQTKVWIDLESGVRTNDKFDINKVKSILEKTSKFINYD